MSADLLREAAALMRARAEAATSGPTLTRYAHGGGRLAVFSNDKDRALVADFYGEGNREHYTSWHPAVALAVADWLDALAFDWSKWTDIGLSDAEVSEQDLSSEHAVTIARAYLGRTA